MAGRRPANTGHTMLPEVLTREESGALPPATARLDSPCSPRHPDL